MTEPLRAAAQEQADEIIELLVSALHFIPVEEKDLFRDMQAMAHDLRTQTLAQPAQQRDSKDAWISVDKQLPEQDVMVLVWVRAECWEDDDEGKPCTTDASEIDLGIFRNCKYGGDGYMENFAGTIGHQSMITHWMPLPPPPATDLSAMTAERDKWQQEHSYAIKAICAFTNSLNKARSERDKWQTAHADTLTEIRKLGEELGALKGKQFEMSKDAARWQFWLKQSGSDLRNKEIQAMWAGCKTNYPSPEEWIAAVDAAIVTKNTGEQS